MNCMNKEVNCGVLLRVLKTISPKDTEGEGIRQNILRFLVFSHASCDETINQLEMINRLYFEDNPIDELIQEFNNLGGEINRYIQYVENNWRT